MKIAIDDLYAVSEPLKDLYGIGMPVRLALQLKRLLKAISGEIELIEPERMKLMEKYQKGKTETGNFVLPNRDDPDFADFNNEYHELFSGLVEIPYEKIDLSFLETDKRMADAIIKPRTLDVIDALNRVLEVREVAVNAEVVDVAEEVKKLEDAEFCAKE